MPRSIYLYLSRRFPAVLLVSLIAVVVGQAWSQPFGLESREPIGPYFGGRFPKELPDFGEFIVVDAFPNLSFSDPVGLVPEPGSRRFWVHTRQGYVLRFEKDPDVAETERVLDLSKHTQGWDDSGLLGLAFHPEFGDPASPNRGYFYVFYQYTSRPRGSREQRPNPNTLSYNQLSRFTIPDGAVRADPESELVLIQQRDRHVWHNGGSMFFHPTDRFLYVSLGDEGGADSQFGNAQRIDKGLFSGVIRIDVDQNAQRSHPIRRQPVDGETAHYFIPNDNPFVDPAGSVLEEFWCLGLREPHRMSYDAASDTLWLGDVGQGGMEEIDVIVKGGNYQWAYREGSQPGPDSRSEPLIGFEVPPVWKYAHSREDGEFDNNNCVIGGFVYRGTTLEATLGGRYIFGDNGSGRIWALRPNPAGEEPEVRLIARMPPGFGYTGLSSFGTGRDGELYLCQMGEKGKIYRLAKPPSLSSADLPPRWLSETGLFTDLARLEPAPGLVPYRVNTVLWSDGAVKRRWVAVPNNGEPFSASEPIKFVADDSWQFPPGTVFVKHFDLPLSGTDPTAVKRIETRVLVRDQHGGVYGVTYDWRDDLGDAELVLAGFEEALTLGRDEGSRTQTWFYPGPRDCLACHTPSAGYVLGVRTHQLNGKFAYPKTGVLDNQLRTWDHLGLIELGDAGVDFEQLPHSFGLDAAEATLTERARSYLDANCSQCHRPGGVRASFDARWTVPLERQGLVQGPVENNLGLSGAAVVTPGSPERSILYRRMNRLGRNQMPPLARNRIHSEAVDLIADWIRSLPGPAKQPGLKGEYYDDISMTDLRMVRTDPRISFNWNDRAPRPDMRADSFSVRWTGELIPRFTEEYRLETVSDDGVRLWINDELIIDNWTDHPPATDIATLMLQAGEPVSIRIEYFENIGGARIRLIWRSASQVRQIIPPDRFMSFVSVLPEFFPPYLFSFEMGDGNLRFLINAEQAGVYEVQRSTDLLDWEPVQRFENRRGILRFETSASGLRGNEFFRVTGASE